MPTGVGYKGGKKSKGKKKKKMGKKKKKMGKK